MTLRYSTLDVFTDRPFGGNPLAVFCDQPELSDAQMQAIAREFNLSETVFIVPPRDSRALRRLRIFTPARELPFAGHPTIGAVHMLVDAGIANFAGDTGEFALELEVGLVPIRVQRRADGAALSATHCGASAGAGHAGTHRAPSSRSCFRSSESDILADRDFAQSYSCGMPFLFVPVRDRAALAQGEPGQRRVEERRCGARGPPQAFVFCRDPELPALAICARVCSRLISASIEDPATGGAAAAFAGYLAARESMQTGTLRWVVEQGFEMGRPSLLYVEADVAEGTVVPCA